MNKTFLIVGGVAVVGIVGFILYKKRQSSNEEQEVMALEEKALEQTQQAAAATAQAAAAQAAAEAAAAAAAPTRTATPPPPITVAPNLAQQGRKEIRQCRKEARRAVGIGLSLAKRIARRNYRNQCIAEGGIDEGGEDFAFGFSNEDSAFAFNGHTF
jgi:hypothetical protein